MMAALRHEAVLAKEALSADTEADVNIVLADGPHSVRINRSELETLVRPALARTVEVLERAIGSAGLAPGDLSAILLSGGASRTPLISQLIGQRMTTPVITHAHPKYVVALGAAASTSTDRSLPPSPRPAAAAAAVVATAPNATTPPAAPPPPEPPTAAPEPAPPAPPADTPTAPEPSEPERRKPRRRLVLLGVLAVLAIAAVAAFLVANRSDKQGVAATSTATQLVLEPASSPGSGAFIAFVSDVTTTTAPPPTTAVTSGTLDGPVRRGDEPGVYGSVRGQATCSPAQLAAAITTNTAAASAFASAENMTPADVDAFIKALTPVDLLHDTVVTNHRLTDGQAVGRTVRARGGHTGADRPLRPAACALPGWQPPPSPYRDGRRPARWHGVERLRVDQVETIKAAELPVASFVLTDTRSGLQFEQPGATAGEADTDVGGTTTTTTLAPASSSSSQKSSSSSSSAPTGGPNTTSDLHTVPNMIGLTKSQATNAVTNAGLAAAFNCQFDSQASPDGTVVSQNPAAGTQAPFGSTVNFDVNTSGSC